MVIGFTTTCTNAISVYLHKSFEFEPRSWQNVLDVTLSMSVTCDRLVVFSGYSVSSAIKTDRHDITETLLKITLSTINHNQSFIGVTIGFNVCFAFTVCW